MHIGPHAEYISACMGHCILERNANESTAQIFFFFLCGFHVRISSYLSCIPYLCLLSTKCLWLFCLHVSTFLARLSLHLFSVVPHLNTLLLVFRIFDFQYSHLSFFPLCSVVVAVLLQFYGSWWPDFWLFFSKYHIIFIYNLDLYTTLLWRHRAQGSWQQIGIKLKSKAYIL